MKAAVCEKCGERLPGVVPVETTNVVCFSCANPGRLVIRRRREEAAAYAAAERFYGGER